MMRNVICDGPDSCEKRWRTARPMCACRSREGHGCGKEEGFPRRCRGVPERALPRQRRRNGLFVRVRAVARRARATCSGCRQGKMQIIVMSYCIFGIDATPCLAAWQRWPSGNTLLNLAWIFLRFWSTRAFESVCRKSSRIPD